MNRSWRLFPMRIRLNQIKRLTQTIEKEMGVTPKGLACRKDLEPHLPKILVAAGVEFITIDDYHFKKSGLKEEDLFGII